MSDPEHKKICIYCGRDEDLVTFSSREHVIPELLGTFENNLTLRGWVCNDCNSSTFNALETRFKEDTEEGIFCQMVNFSDSAEIRVRNANAKLSFDLGIEEKMFNQTFSFLTYTDDGWRMLFQPQIIVKGYGSNGYIVLLVEKIKTLPRDGKKFRSLKNILRNAVSKDVSIFTNGEEDSERKNLNEAMDLVRELGIDYKAGTEASIPFIGDGTDKHKAQVAMDFTIGYDTARVIAKIAFNYLAYCATESGNAPILYHENFDRIKSYILGTNELPIKEVIVEQPSYAPFLSEENKNSIRLVGHIVTFSNVNGNIIANVSFAGRLVYKILLGKTPDELKRP